MSLLRDTVALHDVHDAEAFVRAAIRDKPGLKPSADQLEELVQTGLLLLVRLAERYQPGFGGRDAEGSRFSGFAAKYLRLKLGDEWHRLEGHTLTTLPSGKRVWTYPTRPASLDSMTEQAPEGADHIRALHTGDAYFKSDLAKRLGAALDERWETQRRLIIQVGVLLGEEEVETASQAAAILGVRVTDVHSAIASIQQVRDKLTTLEAA